MVDLKLKIATWDYDRVRPIIDGRIPVDGCVIDYDILEPEETFAHNYSDQKYHVAELGLVPYMIARSRNAIDYRALPIFLSRMFRHSAIYIRKDSGITTPGDLCGRRVGVPAYQQSAAMWARGMLSDQHGVAYESIQWVQAGATTMTRDDMFGLSLPDGFPLERMPASKNLSKMLVSGDLDAVISARAPEAFTAGHPNIGRLFDDFKSAEKAYFSNTGIFPIMHALGIRQDIADAHPWLADNLYRAYASALQIALQDLNEVVALKIALPWVAQELAETKSALGQDYWRYGVAENRTTLDALIRYGDEQGLCLRAMTVDDLFLPVD